jgi:molybdopterin-biosynthesis enzyme MoeA-like protein
MLTRLKIVKDKVYPKCIYRVENMSIKASIKNIETYVNTETNDTENIESSLLTFKNGESVFSNDLDEYQQETNLDFLMVQSEITQKTLEELKTKLENLDHRRHVEILHILHKNNVMYTENSNGIFVNMNSIDKEIVCKLCRYVKYLEKQEKIIDCFEKEKKEYLKLL